MIEKSNILKKNKIFLYITYAISLAFVLFNYEVVLSTLISLLSLAMPFYVAIIIAFLLNVPMKKIESLLEKKIQKQSLRRGLSLLLTFVLVFVVIGLFSAFIIPKLVQSMSLIFSNLIHYSNRLVNVINNILSSLNIPYTIQFNNIQDALTAIDISHIFTSNSTHIGERTLSLIFQSVGFFGTLINGIMSFVMAIYLLLNKEGHITQVKKLVTFLFGYKKSLTIIEIGQEANHYFNGFITGQLLEALIVMVLMYGGMKLTGMPFPELIAVIIGLVSIVPMFGSFIGFFIGLVLVLSSSPEKAILYIITFTVIQQFEGNVIYPRVVGNAVGISGLFVLIALTVFGNLFGFFGLLIAVPSMALIYAIASRVINITLYRKGIVIDKDKMKKIDMEN